MPEMQRRSQHIREARYMVYLPRETEGIESGMLKREATCVTGNITEGKEPFKAFGAQMMPPRVPDVRHQAAGFNIYSDGLWFCFGFNISFLCLFL